MKHPQKSNTRVTRFVALFAVAMVSAYGKAVQITNSTTEAWRVGVVGGKILAAVPPGDTVFLNWDFVSDGITSGTSVAFEAYTVTTPHTVYHTRTGVTLTENSETLHLVVYGSRAGAENIHFEANHMSVPSPQVSVSVLNPGTPNWFSWDDFWIGIGAAWVMVGPMFAYWMLKRTASNALG